MLDEVVRLCPEALWERRDRFYYMTYHTTIFLDYYLNIPVRDFHPPLPYRLVDPDQLPDQAIDDVIPVEHYPREAIRSWLTDLSGRARNLILNSSDADLQQRWIQEDEWDLHLGCPSLVREYSVLEILFYNFRHVQHHVAQLNQILRSEAGLAADWVSQVEPGEI